MADLTDIVFLKLGGSILTDKTREEAFLPESARRLGGEIREALAAGGFRLLLGHGAGPFGHFPAKRHNVREGLPGGSSWEGYWETRRSVMALNALLVDEFAAAGFRPHVLQPSAAALARDGVLCEMDTAPIQALLDADQVPLVFGDAVLDITRGFTIISTETLFAHLARSIRATRIVIACDVPGVLDAPPASGGKLISLLDENNAEDVFGCLAGSSGVDVTGGMAHKVRMLWRVVEDGLCSEVRIINGNEPRAVRDALLGRYEGGTVLRDSRSAMKDRD